MLAQSSQPMKTPLPLSAYQLRVRVQAGDRWLIAGVTGSGKTTFSKLLLKALVRLYPTSRIYVFDSKFQGDFDDLPGRRQQDNAPSKPGRNERYQVWQPVIEVPEQIERWLFQVRKDAPAILLIDELLSLCYTRTTSSEEYKRIQKLGRALPIGCITCTQELAEIPRNAVGQATHIARFRLTLPYEQRFMNTLLRSKVEEPPDNYGFYYSNAVRGQPLYFPSAQRFL